MRRRLSIIVLKSRERRGVFDIYYFLDFFISRFSRRLGVGGTWFVFDIFVVLVSKGVFSFLFVVFVFLLV